MSVTDVSETGVRGFVATDENGPRVGCIHARRVEDGWRLHQLEVDLRRRGEGIGRELVDALLSSLDVGTAVSVVTNPQSADFYRRCGFAEAAPGLYRLVVTS